MILLEKDPRLELVENLEKYLVQPTDKLPAYDCLKCGGCCCTNADVMIFPYDVWRIVHTPEVAQPHGIRTSHDLFVPRREGEEPLLHYYLGPQSRMPLACINMVEVAQDARICPFNAPVVVLRDRDDLKNLAARKFETLEFIKAKYGNLSRLCTLEKAKPTLCRAYPLGRVTQYAKDKPGAPLGTQYVKVDTTWCDQFAIPGSEIPVSDYVKKWGLEEGYKMNDLVFQWHRTLEAKVPSEELRYKLGVFLYDFDFPAVTMAEGMKLSGDARAELIQKFRPQTFEALLDRVYELTDAATRMQP